jgi:SAM-dependent methyltransferase
MSTVDEHYERLLARHYTWMFGTPFEEKVREQKLVLSRILTSLPNKPESAVAIDLGSGPGFQTIALAELGFSSVIAIDTSSELLEELRSHAHGLPVQIEKADLRELTQLVASAGATVVVCMGDTLTHLPGKTDVSSLFQGIFQSLVPGGIFVITYRDLTMELEGVERFIPVRSDDNTIMTCFLEYESPESVIVHDLLHTRQEIGWSLSKSSYRKLRLSVEWLVQELTNSGLVIES